MGFSEGWQGCSVGFPRPKPDGNPDKQPCQPEENPVLPYSFTQTLILFLIGFCIGPPKMHGRLRIDLPKIHRRLRIGPPKIRRRFRIDPQSSPVRIPQSVNSGVPWLLCKKNNTASYLKLNNFFYLEPMGQHI